MNGFWDMLGWDDEEHAEPPYVHIYSDAGAIAALYYTTPEEHEQALEFARRLTDLHAFVVDMAEGWVGDPQPRAQRLIDG